MGRMISLAFASCVAFGLAVGDPYAYRELTTTSSPVEAGTGLRIFAVRLMASTGERSWKSMIDFGSTNLDGGLEH